MGKGTKKFKEKLKTKYIQGSRGEPIISSKIKNSIGEKEEIVANIKWFHKFPLEKRFEIAEMDTKVILEFKNFKIEDNNEESK